MDNNEDTWVITPIKIHPKGVINTCVQPPNCIVCGVNAGYTLTQPGNPLVTNICNFCRMFITNK